MTAIYRVGKSLSRASRVLPKPVRRRLRRAVTAPQPWERTLVEKPPACPPGMDIAAPDFVGVGVQRAGTTWWWNVITQHPQVFCRPDQHKELRYLMARFVWDPPEENAAARYAEWFPRPPGCLTGEWTPRYISHPWCGAALSVLAPNARILVMLRDPIERYISGMTNSALRAERMKPTNEPLEVLFSGYARLLRMLEQRIPRERVLVLQYERCALEPEVQAARTFEFLGLDPVTSEELRTRVNVTSGKRELSDARREQLTEAFAPDVDELVERYPEIDRSLWPNFA